MLPDVGGNFAVKVLQKFAALRQGLKSLMSKAGEDRLQRLICPLCRPLRQAQVVTARLVYDAAICNSRHDNTILSF